MTVLFDISHAGQVHFFRNSIRTLQEKQQPYVVIAKEKDKVIELLNRFHIPFYSLGSYRSNIHKLLKIPNHTVKIRRLIDQFKVEKVLGIHPVHASLAARGKSARCIGFADSEHMFEQIALYWPNVDEVYTSAAFKFRFGTKHRTYRGFHELAYLHPKYFKPTKSGLEDLGLFDNGPPILYRMINWDATHDIGIKTQRRKEINLILKLSKIYPVVLSVEGKLPRELKHLGKSYPANRLHDILAFSSMYVGAGATTAIESTILGTPSVYTNVLQAGVLDFLESNSNLFAKYPNYLRDPDSLISQMDFIMQLDIRGDNQRIIENSIDVKKLIDHIINNNDRELAKYIHNLRTI